MNSANRHTEEGNLLILGLGIWIFLISLILVVGAAVNIHNLRKDLLADTDAHALRIAQYISDSHYYLSGEVGYDHSHLAEYVAAHSQMFTQGDRVVDIGLLEDNTVSIQLCRDVDVVLGPQFLNLHKTIEMCATSSARLEFVAR
ncbi:hypothetical protein [Arcanobacterium pinnipediorum]|uniref:Flp pilus-assembly TadG-like N-terminal domain-containing protein n=1 Tax=Arcanobacterium pinnipediorum TaxID=1503041 RepID=A0ABY5AFY1_9ACTO|nr:hypothetical protein [Arcanobacterium pinnipediorum]USR78952.1 hypothetical protein NG665_06050 [Arcanobacterium pinnipediorum]